MTDSGNCVKHLFERSSGHCDQCGHAYCQDCLLQPFPRKPPICKACAMALGGIRTTAKVRPVGTRKEIKALQKARVAAEQAAAEEGPRPARSSRAARSTMVPPKVNPSQFVSEGDVVPPILAAAEAPARSKRLWRAAG